MKALIKKIIRTAPVIISIIGIAVILIGLPGLFIYTDGIWFTFLMFSAIILICIAWVIFCNWMDELGKWAKE